MTSPIKASITCKTVALAVSLATVAGAFYLYKDPRHCRRRFLSRLWFILCKRDLSEAHLERQLIKERKVFFISKTKKKERKIYLHRYHVLCYYYINCLFLSFSNFFYIKYIHLICTYIKQRNQI